MLINRIELFLTLKTKCDGSARCITPYMHIMTYHMPGCIEPESLRKFSCQGRAVMVIVAVAIVACRC